MTHKTICHQSVAKKAGIIMLAHFGFGIERILKKDGSPVTKADLAINKMVVDEKVKKHFPSTGF